MRKIPLTKPYISQSVKNKVRAVLESGYITEGPVTKEFETFFKKYIGCEHAIAVTSCTTGLEMALRALNIGPGDEVILPDYTYPATADAVAIVGAKIVLVDISRDTMLIDYDQVQHALTEKTKAIIAVSLFGNPLDHDRLNVIKEKHSLHIIEDAACSLGAEYKGIKIGNQADISVFSLHPRKFITTGEGGMITTNRSDWAEWMQSYKHFGMKTDNSRLHALFNRIGTNYKLSDILAAVGLAQMHEIATLLNQRLQLAKNYASLLNTIAKVKLPDTTANGKHSFQSFCIYIEQRDRVLREMRERGVEVQIGTYALHRQPAFYPSDKCNIHGNLSGSDEVFETCLALPLHHELTSDDQLYIVDMLERILRTTRPHNAKDIE
jgi:dTDP-4-amino-4,6-dideoxygalactose transaminase